MPDMDTRIINLLAQHPTDAFTVRCVTDYLGFDHDQLSDVAGCLRRLSGSQGPVRYLGRSNDPRARYTDVYRIRYGIA